MDQNAPRKIPRPPQRIQTGKRAVINMELLYDTTLITAAVFVFALFLSVAT